MKRLMERAEALRDLAPGLSLWEALGVLAFVEKEVSRSEFFESHPGFVDFLLRDFLENEDEERLEELASMLGWEADPIFEMPSVVDFLENSDPEVLRAVFRDYLLEKMADGEVPCFVIEGFLEFFRDTEVFLRALSWGCEIRRSLRDRLRKALAQGRTKEALALFSLLLQGDGYGDRFSENELRKILAYMSRSGDLYPASGGQDVLERYLRKLEGIFGKDL